jgi:hypothetical protein
MHTKQQQGNKVLQELSRTQAYRLMNSFLNKLSLRLSLQPTEVNTAMERKEADF